MDGEREDIMIAVQKILDRVISGYSADDVCYVFLGAWHVSKETLGVPEITYCMGNIPMYQEVISSEVKKLLQNKLTVDLIWDLSKLVSIDWACIKMPNPSAQLAFLEEAIDEDNENWLTLKELERLYKK